MIKYKVILMLSDDTLRGDSCTLGVPIDGKTEIVTFCNGCAEVSAQVAQFVRENFSSRMIVKEEAVVVVPSPPVEEKPKTEVVEPKFEEKQAKTVEKPKKKAQSKKRSLRPAVVKSADTLKTPKRKRSKK